MRWGLIILVLAFSYRVDGSTYYRCKGEAVNGTTERKVDRAHVGVLQVGIIQIFKEDIQLHLNWLLNGILYHIDRPVRISSIPIKDIKTWQHPNSLLITYSSLNWYFKWLNNNNLSNLNVSVIHLGDEGCDQNYEFYSNTPFVLRNYYCEDVFQQYQNSYYLPRGWYTPPDAFGLRNPLPARMRSYDFSLVALMSPDRKLIDNMLLTFGILENYPNMFTLQPISNRQSKYFWMDRPMYNGYMTHSQIGIVPGNSTIPPGNETARFYESLGAGAIPLAYNATFITEGLFGGKAKEQIPFPLVNNWRRSLLPNIEKAHHDKKWAQDTQKKVLQWWNGYVTELRLVVRNLVDNVMNDVQLVP